MNAQEQQLSVPTWTLGDRMHKALRSADMGVSEMADYLGVARNTVSTWIHDKIRPSKQTLRLWSMRTGVSLTWIETGQCPQQDSNLQPTDYQVVTWPVPA